MALASLRTSRRQVKIQIQIRNQKLSHFSSIMQQAIYLQQMHCKKDAMCVTFHLIIYSKMPSSYIHLFFCLKVMLREGKRDNLQMSQKNGTCNSIYGIAFKKPDLLARCNCNCAAKTQTHCTASYVVLSPSIPLTQRKLLVMS